MTTEVLKSGRSEFDKFVDEIRQAFEKCDKYLANREKTATEVNYRSTLCGANSMFVKLIINSKLIKFIVRTHY